MRRDVFQAIADPVRRDIIELLAKETLTVNTVAQNFRISRPAISKHIKILNECGLIKVNKKGREHYCEIQAAKLIPAFLWLDRYRTLSLKRTFDAPLKLVWDAWTSAEHIIQWWGPKGMETKVVAHDFRVGGKWKYIMLMPDGTEFISEGVYSKIIEFKKIETSADFKPMTLGVEIQVLFEESGDKTIFTLICVYPTEEYCKQQEKMGFYNGWGSVFNRLEAYLQESDITL